MGSIDSAGEKGIVQLTTILKQLLRRLIHSIEPVEQVHIDGKLGQFSKASLIIEQFK